MSPPCTSYALQLLGLVTSTPASGMEATVKLVSVQHEHCTATQQAQLRLSDRQQHSGQVCLSCPQHAECGTELHSPLPHASLLKGGRKTRWPGCSTVPASVLPFRAYGPKQFQHDGCIMFAGSGDVQHMASVQQRPYWPGSAPPDCFHTHHPMPLWKSEAQYGRSPHLELNQVNNKGGGNDGQAVATLSNVPATRAGVLQA